MLTLAVCAEMVLRSLPIEARVRRIADLGFAVEIGDWTRHDIEVMVGFNRRFDPSLKALRDLVQDGEIGDVDAAMVTLRAASGALIHISSSRRCAYGCDQRVEAFGARGMLPALNRHPTTVVASGAERTGAGDPVLDFFIERYREAYDAEVDHFVDCVEQGRQPPAGFAEGREALRLADAALESMRSGRTVRLGE